MIEDDEFIRESLKMIFENEGYDIAGVTNGQEGVDYLNSGRPLPQIILLDLMMPVKDGFEFRKEQAGNPKFSSIPVVVLTAEGFQSERKVNLKAQAFVRKPFDIDEIITAVKEQCP